MSAHERLELLFTEGPDHDIFRAQAGRFALDRGIGGIAEHHNGQFRPQPAQPRQQVETLPVAARYVQQKQMGCRAGLYSLHSIPPAGRRFQMPGVGLGGGTKQSQNGRFVAYNQQAECLNDLGSHGRSTLNYLGKEKRFGNFSGSFDFVSFYFYSH